METGLMQLSHQMLTDLSNFGEMAQQLSAHTWVFAQYKDTLGSDVQNAWNNFVTSGQAWALMIGLMVGYFFSKLTSY
jgi:hypothetical protein